MKFNFDKFKEAVLAARNDLWNELKERVGSTASISIGMADDIIYTVSATKVAPNTPCPIFKYVAVSDNVNEDRTVAPDPTVRPLEAPSLERYTVISWSGGDWPERVECYRSISRLIEKGWLPVGGVSVKQIASTGEVVFAQAMYLPINSPEQNYLEDIVQLLRNRFLN